MPVQSSQITLCRMRLGGLDHTPPTRPDGSAERLSTAECSPLRLIRFMYEVHTEALSRPIGNWMRRLISLVEADGSERTFSVGNSVHQPDSSTKGVLSHAIKRAAPRLQPACNCDAE